MRFNPQATARNGLHLLTAAVAGPALVWAGFRYPGSWKARAFLVSAGVLVVATHYRAFSREVRPLLEQK